MRAVFLWCGKVLSWIGTKVDECADRMYPSSDDYIQDESDDGKR